MDLPDTPTPRPTFEPLILPSTGSEFNSAFEQNGNYNNGMNVQKRTTPQSPSTSTQTPPEFSMGEIDHADSYSTESFWRYCKRHYKMIGATGVFSFLFILVCCWTGYCAYYIKPNLICYEHQYKVLVVVAIFTLIAALYGIVSIILDRIYGRNNKTGFTFNTTGFNY